VALVVLDASVVIAFLDPDDALHDAAAAALIQRQHDELVMPASVYTEILVAPYRSGAEAVAEVDAFLSDLAVRIEPITTEIARGAARLPSASRRRRLPDALVLAMAEELGAATALSRDESCAAISRRVTLIQHH
jgi:predicted nucleic acid-binding protein